MDKKIVTLPAQLTSVKSRVDRTWSLTFGTPELPGAEASQLTGMLMDEVYLLISREGNFEAQDIPEVKPDASATNKTPSQRLRSTLHVWWEQSGSKGDFESFYLQRMEQLIDWVKGKLDKE